MLRPRWAVLWAVCSGLACGPAPTTVTCGSMTNESCTFTSLGQCQSHAGTVVGFDAECAGNTYASGPCPTAGRVGGCAAGAVLFSYYAPLTAVNAKATCTQNGGTWCP
jgi:hypothetical protein